MVSWGASPDGSEDTECSEGPDCSEHSQDPEDAGVKHSDVLDDERDEEVYEAGGHYGSIWRWRELHYSCLCEWGGRVCVPTKVVPELLEELESPDEDLETQFHYIDGQEHLVQ